VQQIAPQLAAPPQQVAYDVQTCNVTSQPTPVHSAQQPAALPESQGAGTPGIVTPQPRHPSDNVNQLLQRYLTRPPSPERSYEAHREHAFASYHAHLQGAVQGHAIYASGLYDTASVHSALSRSARPSQAVVPTVSPAAIAPPQGHTTSAAGGSQPDLEARGRPLHATDIQDATRGQKRRKKTPEPRKPMIMACLFCRGRKIACGAPAPGSADRSCE
jgi:hypothetical protein